MLRIAVAWRRTPSLATRSPASGTHVGQEQTVTLVGFGGAISTVMKFATPRRANPFDNPLVSGLVHVVATVAVGLGFYFSVQRYALMPLCLGAAILAALEGTWWYFLLRRRQAKLD